MHIRINQLLIALAGSSSTFDCIDGIIIIFIVILSIPLIWMYLTHSSTPAECETGSFFSRVSQVWTQSFFFSQNSFLCMNQKEGRNHNWTPSSWTFKIEVRVEVTFRCKTIKSKHNSSTHSYITISSLIHKQKMTICIYIYRIPPYEQDTTQG